MKITLKLSPDAAPIVCEYPEGAAIEQIANDYAKECPYRIYAARVDNVFSTLDTRLDRDCELVLLDMRDGSAKEVFQNSLISMYVEAVHRKYPGADVRISTAVNKGIFTYIRGMVLSQFEIDAIEKEMRAMSKADVPFSELSPVLTPTTPSTGRITNFDLKKVHDGIVIRVPQDTHPEGLVRYDEELKLMRAFQVKLEWDTMLGINTIDELNAAIDRGETGDLIAVAEALHNRDIAQLAAEITSTGKRIVLIAGPSSSGKTSFAKRLCTQLWVNGKKPLYLGTDDYFISRAKIPFGPDGKQNFEDLDAIDVDLFNKQLNDLLEGREADLPRFDFQSGEPVFGERIVTCGPDQPIVIEGIHALNEALTPQIDDADKFRIYISPLSMLSVDRYRRIPLTDIRKLRRIVRDARKRGWNAKHTIDNWASVRAGEDKNIFPYSDNADAIFNSTLVYELAALKNAAVPMLEDIGIDDPCYGEAQRLLRLLGRVHGIEDEYIIPNNSIIREFIGGSVIA